MTARFVSSDGLMSSSTPEGAALWDSIVAKGQAAKGDWTAKLRAMDVKLAHPDDGWVHRPRRTFSLSWYAQFDDKPKVGDLIAFGRPPHGDQTFSIEATDKDGMPVMRDGYRLCRVTVANRHSSILGYFEDFEYEDTGVRVPALKPAAVRVSRFRRLFKRATS